MRWTASVFARAIYFWRSVSPVCCPSKSGWHRYSSKKPNVRPLRDWVWRTRGWVFFGPNIHLIGFPSNKGNRILAVWVEKHPDGYVFCLLSASFFYPFFWKVYIRFRGVIYIPSWNKSTESSIWAWTRNAPSEIQDPQPNCITLISWEVRWETFWERILEPIRITT